MTREIDDKALVGQTTDDEAPKNGGGRLAAFTRMAHRVTERLSPHVKALHRQPRERSDEERSKRYDRIARGQSA